MADGTIPELQRACLEGLGAWLDVNGEAIFGTRPWRTADGVTAGGVPVRYTRKGDTLYAILLDAPKVNPVILHSLRADRGTSIHLLGHEEPLSWRQEGDRLAVVLPQGVGEAPAYALRITPQPRLLKG
jgi:alpha-L-fucosidase